MGLKADRIALLEHSLEEAQDLAEIYRAERDRLARQIDSTTVITVTREAAEALVAIRSLYSGAGGDEHFLRLAQGEIEEARRVRISQAAIAMQSDSLDAALQRCAGLEESVEIAKAAMHDAQRELRERAQAGRLQAARLVEEKDEARRLARVWEEKARDAGALLEERRVQVENWTENATALEGEVDRLRRLVEEIALGVTRAPATPREILEALRDRLDDAPEPEEQGVEESDRSWLIRRGWHSLGGTLDEWTRGDTTRAGLRLFGTSHVAIHQRCEDERAAAIAELPVLAYGGEFILEWKGKHRTKLFVHSYSWTVESGATTITCRPTPPGAPIMDAA